MTPVKPSAALEAFNRIAHMAVSHAGSFLSMDEYQNTYKDVETIRTALLQADRVQGLVSEVEATILYLRAHYKDAEDHEPEVQILRGLEKQLAAFSKQEGG